jgi:hypothetical protein
MRRNNNILPNVAVLSNGTVVHDMREMPNFGFFLN